MDMRTNLLCAQAAPGSAMSSLHAVAAAWEHRWVESAADYPGGAVMPFL
jgi:hypothetical protein